MNVRIETTWKEQLKEEWDRDYFARLTDFVRQRYQTTTVYPPVSRIFAAFDACPFDKVKVVILGQDPYHGPHQANGLCFSVNEGVDLPPSLVNIFKEVSADLGRQMPADGNLERWARQGVLLLNATLTVDAHKAGSHQGRGWEEFTDAAVRALADGHDGGGIFTDSDLADAVEAAFDALDRKDTGAEKKMGTTMTFLKLHDKGATIAHIGDSRVYHIRPGKTGADTKILHETTDHSLVNDLIRINELRKEDVATFKHKNVITRAMQPRMDNRPKADVYHTADIRPGDYFYMCSDGMLEQADMDSGESLLNIFSTQGGDTRRKVEILSGATADNRDNHTAFVIHIADVIDDHGRLDFPTDSGTDKPAGDKPARKNHGRLYAMFAVAVIAALCLIALNYLKLSDIF